MLSPPTTSAPVRAVMPATKTWLPTTRVLDHVCGGGSGTAELETRRFFIGACSFPWHGVIEEDLDRGILALLARPAPPDGLLSQWREGNAAARRFTKPPKEARA